MYTLTCLTDEAQVLPSPCRLLSRFSECYLLKNFKLSYKSLSDWYSYLKKGNN